MFRKFRETLSVFVVKDPARAILIAILILNLVLFGISACVISALAPASLEYRGFWASVFYTVSMILDAGCIQFVIEDIGEAGVGLIIVCMLTVILGMITFTGAVIGYITNYIAEFIQNARSGVHGLRVSGHTVILNWNSRASEIINDLLFTGKKEIVVVLVSENATAVKREIEERISSTLKEDHKAVLSECADMSPLRRALYCRKHRLRNRVTVVVWEGDTYSTKQLSDISLSQAASIILLTKEIEDSARRYGDRELLEKWEDGNANTVKTLVQVAQMTADEASADDQIIIVEVEDPWTDMLVNRIIAHKERLGKCSIVPVRVNQVLGQLLSQFSIMPELNTVYSVLFSNRGPEFFSKRFSPGHGEAATVREYMASHRHAIPLTLMETRHGTDAYFMADEATDCEIVTKPCSSSFSVALNPNYSIGRRNIVIIGHNSKCDELMQGFNAFRGEHQRPDLPEILNITVIDDAESLEKHDRYRSYPYVTKLVEAELFDSERIWAALEEAISSHDGDTSILILSDDSAPPEDTDAAVLTYLIYVQDIIFRRQAQDPGFDRESIDVVVEILNPKNFDVVHNYSVDNVVISNRYISKMVTQIGRKQELYEFYTDILTYDDVGAEAFTSKELYIKDAVDFFADGQLPGECTAEELILAVFDASPEDNKAIVLGYTGPGGKMVLFSGDRRSIPVRLGERDKLIIFSNH